MDLGLVEKLGDLLKLTNLGKNFKSILITFGVYRTSNDIICKYINDNPTINKTVINLHQCLIIVGINNGRSTAGDINKEYKSIIPLETKKIDILFKYVTELNYGTMQNSYFRLKKKGLKLIKKSVISFPKLVPNINNNKKYNTFL